MPWGIRPSTPIPSSHIWVTRMPSDFSLGKHKITVRAVDWLERENMHFTHFDIVLNHDYLQD